MKRLINYSKSLGFFSFSGVITIALSLANLTRANQVTSTYVWAAPASTAWIDHAGSPIVVAGNQVQKLGPDGLAIWTADLSAANVPDFSQGLVFDSANNIYVDGHSEQREFAAAVTVAKISSGGVVVWNKTFPVGQVNEGERMGHGPMALARNGSLYVLGRTGGGSPGNKPATLLRIDPLTGTELNRRDLGNTMDTLPNMGDSALASDSASNIYYGYPGGLISFSADLGLARWTPNKFFRPVRAIVVDHWDNIFVTGTSNYFPGDADWNLYAARIRSSDGAVYWRNDLDFTSMIRAYPEPPFGSPGGDDSAFGGNLIALDSNNQVIVAGYGAYSVDSTTPEWIGGLVLKLDPASGNNKWVRSFGLNGVNGTCTALGIDDKDNIYISGIQGAFDPSNPYGAILRILSPEGVVIQETSLGPVEFFENISQVTLDRKGGVYWADLSQTSGAPEINIFKFATGGRVLSAAATTGNGKTKVLMDTFTHDNVFLETFSSTDELSDSITAWDHVTYGRTDPDISGGPDGNVRILSNRDSDGFNSASVSILIRNDAGVQTSYNSYNVANLRATRIATGSDNKSYILLRSNLDESVQVWRMSATGRREATANFVAIKDTAAMDIAVDGTSIVYLIWQAFDGTIFPWRLNTNLAVSNNAATIYGAGYGVAGAGVGGDHQLRILGVPRSTDAPILWLLNSSGTLVSSATQEGNGGWIAADLSVSADNRSHIIWNDIYRDENQYTVTDANLTQTVLEQFGTPLP